MASAALRGLEGEPLAPDRRGMAQDIAFAVQGALEAGHQQAGINALVPVARFPPFCERKVGGLVPGSWFFVSRKRVRPRRRRGWRRGSSPRGGPPQLLGSAQG